MIQTTKFIIEIIFYLFFNLPVYFYIKYKNKINPLSYLKLNNHPFKGILIGFLLSLLYVILLILKNYLEAWSPLNFNIGILWISGLLVGFLEEVPFRGFILQQLNSRMNFFFSNLLTTLIFLLLHFPLWIITGKNVFEASISISIVSLILGYLYKEFNTLWIPIILHSVFNICVWIGLG